jgi:3-methyladenine DNA glycosylase/8-oxoguanine DNA glycosylase
MKIKISHTVHEEVELSDYQVDDIVLKKIARMLGAGEYLREVPVGKGKKTKLVVKQDDPDWRHGSVSEYYVRDASELDIALFKVRDAIINSRPDKP